jgi:hypothetical protein
MSEAATIDAPSTAPATAPNPAPAPAAPAAPEWLTSLPPELRDAPSLKRYGSVQDLARAYTEAETLIGRKGIIPPGENDPPEVHRKFREALGVPEKPEGYALKPPAGVPEGTFTPESAAMFQSWAHKHGLTPKQAQGLLEDYLGSTAQGLAANEQARAAKVEEAVTTLRGEWGAAYDAKVERANRALKQFGGDDLVAALAETGLANDPRMIRAWAAIGEKMGEDNPAGLGTGRSAGGVLTPAEATAELRRIMGKGAPIWDRKHPEHQWAVQRRDALIEMGASL